MKSKVKNFFNKYYVAIHSSFILTGIILLTISFFTSEFVSKIFYSIGIIVLASSLVTILQVILKIDVVSSLKSIIDINTESYDLGFVSIAINGDSKEIFAKFKNAKQIDLLFNTGKEVAYTYSKEIINAINKNNCKIRVLICSNKADFWSSENVKEALCPGLDHTSSYNDILTHYKHITTQFNTGNKAKGKFELREYRSIPTTSVIIIDNKYMRLIPYLSYTLSIDSPKYYFEKKSDSRVFKVISDSFESIWNNSEVLIKQ